MGAPVIDLMTVDAFLTWENQQELRYELVDGQPFMMTGGSRAHDRVRGGIYAAFLAGLRGKPCQAHIDVKVICRSGNVRYPDAMIDCGPYRPKDIVAAQPTIVVEVLSPSTQAADFLIKLKDYETVPSISTYAIFWQDQARAVIYRRTADRLVPAETLEALTDTIEFSDVGVTLALATVYDGVLIEDL